MLTPIKKLLPQKLRSLGLEGAMNFAKLQEKWDQTLGQALGAGFQKKSRPLKIKKEVLLVDCLNSVWANELQMKEKIILEKIKKAFKDIAVEKIKFIS